MGIEHEQTLACLTARGVNLTATSGGRGELSKAEIAQCAAHIQDAATRRVIFASRTGCLASRAALVDYMFRYLRKHFPSTENITIKVQDELPAIVVEEFLNEEGRARDRLAVKRFLAESQRQKASEDSEEKRTKPNMLSRSVGRAKYTEAEVADRCGMGRGAFRKRFGSYRQRMYEHLTVLDSNGMGIIRRQMRDGEQVDK